MDLRVREYDLSDPSAGLRPGESDLALTRLPFNTEGLGTVPLGAEQVGVVVRGDDPVARETTVRLADLSACRWVRLPLGTNAVWLRYWTGGPSVEADQVVRMIQECLQSVLWNGRLALAPVGSGCPMA